MWTRLLTLCLPLVLIPQVLCAQIPRERATVDRHVEDHFWGQNIILTSSVQNLPRGNLNATIMHSFGLTSGGLNSFFGMDDSANIRLGVDYGLHDRLSVGVGRTRFDKLYDFRFKANLLRQALDDSMPVEVALKGDVGITTLQNGFAFIDRLNYFASLMIARRMSDRLTLQVTPMYSHFNTVFIEQDVDGTVLAQENGHFALGLAGRVVLNRRFSLLAEYLPLIGTRSDGTTNALSVGVDIDTGGHVFQLFFTTCQWLTEQHVVARNTHSFLDGDFRIGFNVNRVFGVGPN